MLGLFTRSVLARSGVFSRSHLFRRMSGQAEELSQVNGNLVLVTGVGLAVGSAAFLQFNGLIVWGFSPDREEAMKNRD